MRIDDKIIDGTLFLGFSGELDEYAAPSARGKLDGLFSAKEIRRVVLDMSELSFMDSTGVGVLIGRFKRLKGREIPMFITNPSRQVDRVLTISGIYNIIPKA